MPRESAKSILPVLETRHEGFDRAFAKLVRRREEVQDDVGKTVRRIIDRVREVGDGESARSPKFDGASLRDFEVNRAEVRRGR
jgi:histidinol dehydrogenase